MRQGRHESYNDDHSNPRLAEKGAVKMTPAAERASSTLCRYFKMAFEAVGLEWYPENQVEVENAVIDLINAAQDEQD